MLVPTKDGSIREEAELFLSHCRSKYVSSLERRARKNFGSAISSCLMESSEMIFWIALRLPISTSEKRPMLRQAAGFPEHP